MIHAVIMAGGSGTRFWPQSRKKLPKQLLRLYGERTMIQQTLDRCSGLIDPQHSWVVTNAVQADLTRQQLPDLPATNVLVEPAARNTAPCIGLAAVHALQQDPDAIMFVMPADHVIGPVEVFQEAAQKAVSVVQQDPDQLVLFGIPPTFPSTGYGYIEQGDGGHGVYQVQSFREKPDLATAESFIESGRFYWNCGIFCWRADAILKQLEEFEPQMRQQLDELAGFIGQDSYQNQLEYLFPQMNSISIDFAVLERATGVSVIEAPFDWDDVGSWLAVPRLAGEDDNGNTIDGNHAGLDTSGCIIRSEGDHVIATLGVEDLIIVHTPDATLVARRDDSERIKHLLEELKASGFEERL